MFTFYYMDLIIKPNIIKNYKNYKKKFFKKCYMIKKIKNIFIYY